MPALLRGTMPSLYAILDAEAVHAAGRDLLETARELRAGGIALLQYRDKLASDETVLGNALRLRAIFAGEVTLILNDRPELCVQAGWDGVHVGQGDTSVVEARRIVGADRIIGVSTHGTEQILLAHASSANYVAIGPVFATGSKRDTEAEVGLAGVSAARLLTSKPLVAIGGISSARIAAVLGAGADAAAVIGALFAIDSSVEENARRLRRAVQPA